MKLLERIEIHAVDFGRWVELERRELEWSENLKETARRLSDEVIQLRNALRGFHDQADIIDSLSRRVGDLRFALRKSTNEKQWLEAQLANRPLLPAAFRRLRDQDKPIEALQARNERLEGHLARLRSTRSVLSKALFGSRSEKQEKPGTGRKRGQQRGAPGHGRTRRPGLGEKTERRKPPHDLSPWLPWSMSEERKRSFMTPG